MDDLFQIFRVWPVWVLPLAGNFTSTYISSRFTPLFPLSHFFTTRWQGIFYSGLNHLVPTTSLYSNTFPPGPCGSRFGQVSIDRANDPLFSSPPAFLLLFG